MNRRDALKLTGLALAGAALDARGMIWHGGSAAQAIHDLLMNLGPVNYFDTQQMFLNVLKQASSNAPYSAWSTWNSGGGDTGEEAYLEQILDANGYPTTLTLTTPPSGGQLFTQLAAGIFVNEGTGQGVTSLYPADTYRFQWQGKGSIKFAGDVKVLANASAGCSIAGTTVTSTNAWGTTNSVTLQGTGGTALSPTGAGIVIIIPAGGITDSANYPKAMTCVQSTYTTQFDGGQIFHPHFLSMAQIAPWKALRFMDSLQVNNQVAHSRYVGYMFSSAPTAGAALPPLVAAWPNQSGQRRITLATGEELLATFATGSTTVTSTANPTITASSSTVPAGELTTDFFWFTYDSWSSRPQLADLTYGSNKGIPYEIAIDLCNLLNCDFWLNVPPQFQSADWASLCSLIVSNLKPGLKCFVEWSNETWNAGTFTGPHWIYCKSEFQWGSNQGGSYVGMITSEIGQQFATTAGNPGFDNTFIVLMPGQAANTAVVTNYLTAPAWTSVPWQLTSASGQRIIKGICIAPYINPSSGPIYAADFTLLQAQPDGGYTDFINSWTQNPVPSGNTYHQSNGTALPSGGWLALSNATVTNHVTAMASYGNLPIYCYEGGWQFGSSGSSPSQETFLDTAARDSRMSLAHQLYFRGIAAAGATPCQYKLCDPYGVNQWGLAESSMQTFSPLSSAPARLQGAVNYVTSG